MQSPSLKIEGRHLVAVVDVVAVVVRVEFVHYTRLPHSLDWSLEGLVDDLTLMPDDEPFVELVALVGLFLTD
jgi:hypothetical protein